MTFEEQINEILTMQKAPPGKFRALGVDSFANPPLGEPYVLCDCADKETAIQMAKNHGGPFNPHCVYDEAGAYIFGAGSK